MIEKNDAYTQATSRCTISKPNEELVLVYFRHKKTSYKLVFL